MRSALIKHPLRIWALLLFISALFPAYTRIKDDLFKISKNLEIFSSLYKQVSLNYVDDVDPDKLMKTGIDAMLNELDPYTQHVREEDVEDYKLKYVSTHYGGIGAIVTNRDGKIVIAEPYANSPAQQAGLKAGDEITRINGVPVRGRTSAEVSNLLKGQKNTLVKLGIQPALSNKTTELTLLRQEITQPNVSRVLLLDKTLGYIKLDKFLDQSSHEVEKALVKLKKETTLTGVILDLRDNGGGILQEAVRIVNLFVPEGEMIVSQRGKDISKQQQYVTREAPLAADIPLIVLVNNRSASASEIVAGAIQDLDRGVIVGQRSFGKGLVQQTFSLPYNNLVKVTIAKYYTPSGRCIQALDYAHRDEKGQVFQVIDSLIAEYKTKGGRSVYDGSGIFPDEEVLPNRYSPISQTLISRYLIFDYATQFRESHPQIAPAARFKVSETQYADFLHFLSDKDYQYSTKTESLIKQLKAEAVKEKKSAPVLDEIGRLEKMASLNKQDDLINHKGEIKELLGNEIVSRYYYQEGRSDFSLSYDKALKHARELLTSGKQQYAAILAGEGTHKTIGKPHLLASSN